ncbi:hypothetical protein BZG36_03408 [Bifiguratus adelaidae]|uniref:Integrase zinc-binding domain-containing protein n=1 Tax=Bifiguratus adelaidae TaxID=1938954 RepID=A0A261XYS3_9FUNG|nr:hypothetical protein BZG36_03408 [Bifiguratus adelaidae]
MPISGHLRQRKTYEQLRRHFMWSGMREEVISVGPLTPLPIPPRSWSDIAMDLIVRLPNTSKGFHAILIIVDLMNRIAHFIPTILNVSAQGVVQLVIHNIVRLRESTAFHPETDDQSERSKRRLEQMLRTYVGPTQRDWDKYLPLIEFAYNAAPQVSPRRAPFEIVLGVIPLTSKTAELVDVEDMPAVWR